MDLATSGVFTSEPDGGGPVVQAQLEADVVSVWCVPAENVGS